MYSRAARDRRILITRLTVEPVTEARSAFARSIADLFRLRARARANRRYVRFRETPDVRRTRAATSLRFVLIRGGICRVTRDDLIGRAAV